MAEELDDAVVPAPFTLQLLGDGDRAPMQKRERKKVP